MFLKYLKPISKCSCVHFHSLLKFVPYNLCNVWPASVANTTITHSNITKKRKSSSESDKEGVGISTILVQDGLNFQELPLIVKKTNKIELQDAAKSKPVDTTLTDNINLLALLELQEKLEKCTTLSELVDGLNEYPTIEYTPVFVTFVLSSLAEFQQNYEFSNEENCAELQQNVFSLLGQEFSQKMCDVLCSAQDTCVILAGLHVVVHNNLPLQNYDDFISRLFNELLVRLNEGNITILQIYEFAALILAVKGDHSTLLDQLWLGIIDKSNDINSTNLVMMYRLLPVLKTSRKIVFRELEKKTYSLWWQLTVQDVNEILAILAKLNLSHAKLLISLSKWINLNIHTVQEKVLAKMLNNFIRLDHIDSNIMTAVERCVKVKNRNIIDPELVSQIMCLCLKFRLRSEIILENISSYFISHASDLSTSHVATIVKTFGMLNYLPQSSYEFYVKIEDIVQAKFVEFRPEDIIELFLACTFVQRHPLNFIERIFNRHFLDRLNTIQNKHELNLAYDNLRLLDAAMTLECKHYRGPMLAKVKIQKHVLRDGRFIRIIDRLRDPLAVILNGFQYYVSNKRLNMLPYSEMYIIDFVIHLDNEGKPIAIKERVRIGKRIAVLIHLPEHYCYQSKCLVGQQAAKLRHLERLGYRTIELDYSELILLQKADLDHYLKNKLFPEV